MFQLEVDQQTYEFRASVKAARSISSDAANYLAGASGVIYELRRGNPFVVEQLLPAMSLTPLPDDFFDKLDGLGTVCEQLEAEILSSFPTSQRTALANLVTQFADSVNTRELELATAIGQMPLGGPSSSNVSENSEPPTPETGPSENSAPCETPAAEPLGLDSQD